MNAPVTVEQLTLSDETAAVASLAAAFADYPLFVALCPDSTQRPRVIAAYCRFLFRLAVRAGGAFGTADRTAVVCGFPPGREWPSTWDELRCGGLSVLWQLGLRGNRRLRLLERGFKAARLRHVPGPHWYISLIGVRPELQRRGLGRAVLLPIFETADRDRVPVYLETRAETNVTIYGRLGFELVGRGDTRGLPIWELLRKPDQPRQQVA